MFISDNIGIIADDLTGANECSLKFHLHGCATEIVIDYQNLDDINSDKQVWTISTESRNVSPDVAVEKVKEATRILKDKFNIEYFYKKIDSTIRGNLAQEALAMLETLKWDATLILPALPSERRFTIGGYHLLKGIPVEKTDIARDPHSPIYESHIPTLLKKQLGRDDIVGTLELTTVLKGAGPILAKINSLIAEGKKLIVCDAASNVDIEQIALAMTKSNYNILPCGSSGFANVLADFWIGEKTYQTTLNALSTFPKLIISGSASGLTKLQIEKLQNSTLMSEIEVIPLSVSEILSNSIDSVVEKILLKMKDNNTVVVHSSKLVQSEDELNSALIDAELTKDTFAGVVSDFLAQICLKVSQKANPIYITIGGETTYKCAKSLNSSKLLLFDEVTQAIPLCLDKKSHWLISKSGNLGNPSTLIDIINYFNQYE